MISEVKYAELLCTRLCHDLTGPIGAIANGAEFLSEEGFHLQSQAIELINGSALQAVARLQYYRRAYGRINDGGEVDLAEQKRITEQFFTATKVQLDWPDLHTDASGVSVSNKMGRLLLNLIIIASATLLKGGTLSIRITATETTKEILVSATGAAIKWDKEIEEVLSGKITLEQLTPRTIQSDMTRELAEEIGAALTWRVNESSVDLVLTQSINHDILFG